MATSLASQATHDGRHTETHVDIPDKLDKTFLHTSHIEGNVQHKVA
jgi:hypothetical protein